MSFGLSGAPPVRRQAIAGKKPPGGAVFEVESRSENIDNKLFVGNLDHRVTEYAIVKLFKPYGKIAREEFIWHTQGEKRGMPRGFCFVEYENNEV